MKRYITFAILLVLLVAACAKKNDAPPTNKTLYMKLFGGAGKETARRLVLLPDGVVAGVGRTESSAFLTGGGKSNIFFFVSDGFGNILIQRGIGGVAGYDINLLDDGNFLLGGEYEVTSTGGSRIKAYMARVDRKGNVLDSVLYAPSTSLVNASWRCRTLSVRTTTRLTPTGATETVYWMAGIAYDGVEEPSEDKASKLFLAKMVKKNGQYEIERERVYGFEGSMNEIASISITEAGDVAVVGTVKNNALATNNPYDARVILTDEWANLKWDLSIDKRKYDKGIDMQKIPEGFIIAATTYDDAGNKDILVQRINNAGGLSQETLLAENGNQVIKSIAYTKDGGCVILADVDVAVNSVKSQTDLLLIKLDHQGNKMWTKNFGSSENDSGGIVKQDANGDIVIFGTFGFVTSQKCGLIRVNSNGEFLN